MISFFTFILATTPVSAASRTVLELSLGQNVQIIKPSKRVKVVAAESGTQVVLKSQPTCTQCESLAKKENELKEKEAALNAKAIDLDAQAEVQKQQANTSTAQAEKQKKAVKQLEKHVQQVQAEFNNASAALVGDE